MQNKNKKVKLLKFISSFIFLNSFLITLASAQSFIYLKNSSGILVGVVVYENTLVNRIKTNSFCAIKKLSEGVTCEYLQDTNPIAGNPQQAVRFVNKNPNATPDELNKLRGDLDSVTKKLQDLSKPAPVVNNYTPNPSENYPVMDAAVPDRIESGAQLTTSQGENPNTQKQNTEPSIPYSAPQFNSPSYSLPDINSLVASAVSRALANFQPQVITQQVTQPITPSQVISSFFSGTGGGSSQYIGYGSADPASDGAFKNMNLSGGVSAGSGNFTGQLNAAVAIIASSTIGSATATNMYISNASVTNIYTQNFTGAGLTSCNASTSKLNYNSATELFECAYESGTASTTLTGNLEATYATITNSTSTNISTTNFAAQNSSLTNISGTNSTITNATSTNGYFSNLLSALSAIFTNLTATNISGTNATLTNATSTNLSVSSLLSALGATFTNLTSTNATFTNATVTNNFATNQYITNASVTNLTIGGNNVTNILNNLNNTFNSNTLNSSTSNSTTTNSVTSNTTNLNSTNSTNTNSTSTNLFSTLSNFITTIITNLTATNLSSTNATLTNATTTNLASTNGVFSNLLSALTAAFTNLTGTNATLTNATATNLSAGNLSVGNLSLGSLNGWIYGTNGVLNGSSSPTVGYITATSSTSTFLGINIAGSIIPLTDDTYDLGDPTHQFKSLYVSSTTIYIDDVALSNSNGQLIWGGTGIFASTTVGSSSLGITNITGLTATNATVTGVFTAPLATGYVWRGSLAGANEATSSLFIANNGFVGIGNTTPSGNLAISQGILTGGAQSGISLNGTWNNAGTIFKGIDVDITNSAAHTNSTLFNLALGGSSVFKVTGAGNTIISGNLSVTGTTTFNSPLDAGSNKIVNVALPTSGNDAANKSYVDAFVQGISYQEPVISISTTTITSSSTGNRYIIGTGSSGTGCAFNAIATNISSGTWSCFTPASGTTAFVDNGTDQSFNFNGTAWVSLGATINHEALIGLQGGSANEHYHLNASQYGNVNSVNAQLGQLLTTGTATQFVNLTLTGGLNISGVSSGATISNATATNFYISNILSALYAAFTNLTSTNATFTNATVTNAFATNQNANTASVTNLIVGGTNITNILSTLSSLFSSQTINSSTTNSTTTNTTNLNSTNSTNTNSTSTNLYASNASTSNLFANIANIASGIFASLFASSAQFTVLYASTTNASTTNTVNLVATNATLTNATVTALKIIGPVYDSTNSPGNNGYILQSTGTSTQWVATSSLGISGGSGSSATTQSATTTFTSSGTFTVPAGVTSVKILVVAGGGGGAGVMGGGGGGGGVISNSNYTVTPGAVLTATVGAGGAGGVDASGANGGNSVFNDQTAIGGGGGGRANLDGSVGGSGGGGGYYAGTNYFGGAGTVGQGNAGGNGSNIPGQGGAGGGGGAGAAGAGASGHTAGTGGIGLQSNISGTNTYYAGGGGGGSDGLSSSSAGGAGGGGAGAVGASSVGTAGTANTGGGGGGAGNPGTGGNGGSGIIIVAYSYSGPTTISSLSSSAATITNATTTTLFSTSASITSATTTSLFSALFNALSSTFTSLFATNATITNATTTNLAISGQLRDAYNTAPAYGMVLLNTGTSTQWVSTSSLGISASGGSGSGGALTSVSVFSTAATNQTYTVPANTSYIEVEVWGGGGGSGGFSGTAGAAGGTSCFGTNATACTSPIMQATGGPATGFGAIPAFGGIGSGGDINLRGSVGEGTNSSGAAPRGGGNSNGTGAGIVANGFGGGAAGDAAPGAGGGYSYKFIASPAASYKYTVGAGGLGGSFGSAGGVGAIVIKAYGAPSTTYTSLTSASATFTAATITNATTTTLFSTSASITSATTTSLFAALFNALTSTFTSLFATNATITNATTTNLAITGQLRDAYSTIPVYGQVLMNTGTSTQWVSTSSLGISSSGGSSGGSLTSITTFTTAVTNQTYTVPANTSYIEVEVWGGGGGNVSFGNTTCFGTNATACTSPIMQATGGSPVGPGGVGSGGDINLQGGSGSNSDTGAGIGGSAPRGGGGAGAANNTGKSFGGGGGGSSPGQPGGGGGGYSYKYIASPAASYKYTVGAGAADVFPGASGAIVIKAYGAGSVTAGSVASGTAGQIAFFAASGKDLSATSSLFINTNGNIGVGTTSAFALLNIFGNATFEGSNRYLNFGATSTGSVGSTGYGIRDNGGIMEVKNSSGAWTPIAEVAGTTGGVGSSNITIDLGDARGKILTFKWAFTVANDGRTYTTQVSSNGGTNWSTIAGGFADDGSFCPTNGTSCISSLSPIQGFMFNSTGSSIGANTSNTALTAGSHQMVRLTVSSGVLAAGAFLSANLNTSGDGDIAEWHETDGTVERGDVVSMTGETISRVMPIIDPLTKEDTGETYTIRTPVLTKATSTSGLLGAVSTLPGGEVIGADVLVVAKHPKAIGISGHVPVKMTLEGGDIKIGDPITVSILQPGRGAKAVNAGKILGYAMENFSATENSEDGMIEVSVDLQDWTPPNTFFGLDMSAPTTTSSTTPFLISIFNNIKSLFLSWFADPSNAIGKFFAKSVHTQELCTQKSDGSTVCVSDDELAKLLNSQNGATTSSTPVPTIVDIPPTGTTTSTSTESIIPDTPSSTSETPSEETPTTPTPESSTPSSIDDLPTIPTPPTPTE